MLFSRLPVRNFKIKFGNRRPFSTSGIKCGDHGPPGPGVYRFDAPPVTYGPRIQIRTAFQIYTFAHIFYHFWYFPEIILGHPKYFFPDVTKWTDEDLGIPPDDYDEEV